MEIPAAECSSPNLPWLGCRDPACLALSSLSSVEENRTYLCRGFLKQDPSGFAKLPGGVEGEQRWFFEALELALNPDSPGVWKGPGAG